MTAEIPKAASSGSIHYHGNYCGIEVSHGREDYEYQTSRSQSCASRFSRLSSTTSSVGQSRHIENWLNQKSLCHLQDNHSLEDFESRQLYTTVLRNEENFVHGINEFLVENDLLNLRRRELLHKEWHENVYVPTRTKIERVFEEKYPHLERRKHEEYLKFLEHKNKRGDIFLDVVTKEEYDPMCLLHQEGVTNIKARTGRLLDPLLAQERQRINEQRTIYRCENGEDLTDNEIRKRWLPPAPLKPLGRHGTTCQTWIEMPLCLMESNVHDRSMKRMKGNSNLSTINFADLCIANQKQSTEKLTAFESVLSHEDSKLDSGRQDETELPKLPQTEENLSQAVNEDEQQT